MDRIVELIRFNSFLGDPLINPELDEKLGRIKRRQVALAPRNQAEFLQLLNWLLNQERSACPRKA
jgi:hypothetical protein